MLPADLNLTAEAVRRLSRNRADIELTFAPVYLGSFDYKPDTMLFLAFLGLILRQALLHELQDLRLSLNLTADDAMTLLCHLSCTFHKGHWFAERGIETLQHQLADKLQLPLCYLEKPVARR